MILFYLLILVMPLARHPFWGMFFGPLTLTKYLGSACFLYALGYLALRRNLPSFFGTWQARLFILFCLFGIVSYFSNHASVSGWELSPLLSYTSFLFLFLVTLALVDSARRLRWVLLVVAGSVAFASLYVLREWQKYHLLYQDFRPGWLVGDPNYFALSALISLPVCFYLMTEERPRLERLFCLGCLIVTLAAFTLAASRGGLVGLVAAFLYVVWHSRQRLPSLALAAALLVPLSFVSPASPVQRLLHPNLGDREATELREALWKAGLRMIDDNPMLGVGLGNFKGRVGAYAEPGQQLDKIAHNTYIEIAAEMGVPALAAFLGILTCSYQSLRRVRQRARELGCPLLPQAALAFQAGLVGYAAAIVFISGEYQKLFWLLVFLSMCLPPLVPAGVREQEGLAGETEQARSWAWDCPCPTAGSKGPS